MDFSQYEHTTPEWSAYTSQNPNLLVDSGIPVVPLSTFRASSNTGRAKWSTAQVAAQGLENRFSMQDLQIPTRDGSSLRMRRYSPVDAPAVRLPAFIHLHGGGYLNGSIETETSICAAIAVPLNMVVLHPEYRHTDAVVFPTMFDDVWDAYDWILRHTEDLGIDATRVVIGGQSAGSGLTAATVQQDIKTSGYCRVQGQILTIPWLMHPDAFPYHRFANKDVTSPVQCKDKSGLSTAKLEWFASLLQAPDPYDEQLNPGLLQEARELDAMPKTAMLVAGGDPLRDQGLFYATSLESAAVLTKVHVFPAVPHTFRSCDGLPSAKLFMERLIESIVWILDYNGKKYQAGEWLVENVQHGI